MMSRINFAIIGCGRIGERHAQHINNLGKLTAVCDIDEDKAKSMGKEYGVPWFRKIQDLLNEDLNTDVVSVCTPNGLHASHTIQSLRSGFHVLCEKPMATSVHECGEMIKEAEKANKRLFIVKQNRFNPAIAAVKKILDENRLGNIYSVQLNCFWNRNFEYYQNSDWKGTRSLDGGTLYTQFSHFIDLLYWLIGDVSEVQALTDNFGHQGVIEFEDTGVIAMKFYNGVIGSINYTVNSYKKKYGGIHYDIWREGHHKSRRAVFE